MSGAYWPLKVAQILKERLGYSNPILDQTPETIEIYLRRKMKDIVVEELLDVPFFNEPANLPLLEES